MNNVNISQMAQELHEAAVEKGFWDTNDATAKHLAKMISELGEVVQADRAGVMYEVERDGGKPEGVVAELADFVMMTLDLMMHYQCVVPDSDMDNLFKVKSDAEGFEQLPAYELVNSAASELVGVNTFTTESPSKPFLAIIFGVHKWLQARGYDLWEIIRQKMEYNKTRPALHGRLY